MAADVRVRLDQGQIRRLEGDPPTRKEIMRAGYQLAKRAATTEGPPRASGKGANSIRGAVSNTVPNAADVAWSQKYYYMIFHHDGWSPKEGGPRRPGNPFLRRAYEAYAHF